MTPSLHLWASPSASRLSCAANRGWLRRVILNGSEAWDLTLDARPAFHFFSLFPRQLPGEAGTHNDVPVSGGCLALRPTISTRRLMLPSSKGLRSDRPPSPAYPHVRFVTERLLSTKHRQPNDWWLLLAASLEPLPPSHCLYSLSGFTARRGCVKHPTWLDRSLPSSLAPQ